jgi:hypothetical protein
MSWSEIENAYLDRLAANAFPGTPPEDQEPVKAASTAQPTAAPAEMRAIPKNETLGAVADFVGRVREMANQYEIKDWVPLLGGLGVGDLLVGKSPEEIENWAYGNAPMRIPEMSNVPIVKTGRKQSLADTAMLGLDVAGPAVGVGKLAKTMATEIATTPPVGAIKIGAAAPVEQVAEIAVKIGEREIKVPADQASILSKAIKNLTPAEQLKFKSDTARTFVERLTALPSKQEFGAAAIGGRAKKGWYEGSTQAIVNVFGPDANRFAALLSATSPQTSVESNLYNALQIWKNWTAAGRPTERDAIIKVMGESVQGGKGEESVLDAWKNNSVAALTAEDPGKLILSGPKVNSFMLNLQGNVEEVTNDAWMASFSLVDQKIFGGSLTKTDPGKGPGYLAMNARVRETATYLTKLTGETWTPAEVQETIWSWAKTLYETAGAAGETRSAVQLVRDNAITDELISSTPDFRTLFYDERFAPILEQAGYGEQLARLRAASSTSDVATGSQKPGTGSQAAAIDPEAQRKLLERNAKRLDTLRKQRELAAAEKAALEKGAK